jgi:type I restriction enzyme M protein
MNKVKSSYNNKNNELTVYGELVIMPTLTRDLMGDFEYEVTSDGKIVDFVTNKLLAPDPEEPVRQWYETILVNNLGYGKNQIDIEVEVQIGSKKGFADIVVYESSQKIIKKIIAEAKRPNRFDGRKQLDSYLGAEEVELGVWTNGQDIEYIHHPGRQVFNNIPELPRNGETIHDITNRLVRSKLIPSQDFRREITECEDIIVGSQGGLDIFDEIFKIIFAKIYDESKNLLGDNSVPEFRASIGEAHSITANRVKRLFRAARDEYSDVFDEQEEIRLSDENIHRITLKLQTLYLFKTDLDVLGEGFEVLIPSKMKLNKGQYFTPRQLVKLAVKMVDPDEGQKILDPACGSGGFLIYCMKYVWRKIANRRRGDDLGIQRAQIRYASSQLFGLDYDDRLVRVAKAYMTIAGDGSSNVRKVIDSLKPYDWDLSIQRVFTNSDILLTNPPFAGDLDLKSFAGDRGLDFVYLNHNLAKKGRKRLRKQRKDILFIEKCIDYVNPDGIIAIVLPKGDLDERNKKYVRDYIKRHCKILAVIALHETMFVPYTGQKTSLVVLQKYRQPLETFSDVEYPIFMAVSEKSGKDKS